MRIYVTNLVAGDMIRVRTRLGMSGPLWDYDDYVVLGFAKTKSGSYDVTFLTSKSYIFTKNYGNVSFELIVPIIDAPIPIANQYTRAYH
jgi:hypothetical protein